MSTTKATAQHPNYQTELPYSRIAETVNELSEVLSEKIYKIFNDVQSEEFVTLLESQEAQGWSKLKTPLEKIEAYVVLDKKMNLYKKMMNSFKEEVQALVESELKRTGESSIKFPQHGANIHIKNTASYEYSEPLEAISKNLNALKEVERENGTAIKTENKVPEIRRVRA